jgi:hypothetical protein
MSFLQLDGLEDQDFDNLDLDDQDLDEQDVDYRDLYDPPLKAGSEASDSDTSSDLGSDYSAGEQIL